jgi:hypothetical protein
MMLGTDTSRIRLICLFAITLSYFLELRQSDYLFCFFKPYCMLYFLHYVGSKNIHITSMIERNYRNIIITQRRHDTLVSCAKNYILLNRKSASIYRYLMRVTLSNFQCFTKPITAFMDD